MGFSLVRGCIVSLLLVFVCLPILGSLRVSWGMGVLRGSCVCICVAFRLLVF